LSGISTSGSLDTGLSIEADVESTDVLLLNLLLAAAFRLNGSLVRVTARATRGTK
jgi:hypothetical protein